MTETNGENLSFIRSPFFFISFRPASAREQRHVLSGTEKIPREVTAEYSRAVYQYFHFNFSCFHFLFFVTRARHQSAIITLNPTAKKTVPTFECSP